MVRKSNFVVISHASRRRQSAENKCIQRAVASTGELCNQRQAREKVLAENGEKRGKTCNQLQARENSNWLAGGKRGTKTFYWSTQENLTSLFSLATVRWTIFQLII